MRGAGGFPADAAAGRQRLQPSPQRATLIGNTLDRKTWLGAGGHDGIFAHIHADIQTGMHDGTLQKVKERGWGGTHRRELADKSAVRISAARFFIDVWGVGGRVLRKSVRCAADVSRCPSTPVFLSFSKSEL
jgi:hypothetical protein